VSWTARLKNEH